MFGIEIRVAPAFIEFWPKRPNERPFQVRREKIVLFVDPPNEYPIKFEPLGMVPKASIEVRRHSDIGDLFAIKEKINMVPDRWISTIDDLRNDRIGAEFE